MIVRPHSVGPAWRKPGGCLVASWSVLLCSASFVAASFLLLLLPQQADAQVFVVGAQTATGTMPAFHPTSVDLAGARLDEKTRLDLIRLLSSEQGFATRPLPRGGKGLTLYANGDLTPDRQDYQKVLYEKGISAGAGDRIVITKMLIKGDRIVLDLNGGPDYHHKYLRHVSIGMDPMYTTPLVQDDAQEPTGARITLVFKKYVPEMTGSEVKALLAPLLDFSLKSPVTAYTDTLPPKIREAILAHQVLVGMNHRMVIASLGQPGSKVREKQDGTAYEEWIFGQPPQDVNFVRFMGDRVVRLEVAQQGKPLIIRTADEMDGYTTPVRERQIAMGDPDPNRDSGQDKPPTLRNEGDPVPATAEQPVQFPKEKQAPPGDSQPSQLVSEQFVADGLSAQFPQ